MEGKRAGEEAEAAGRPEMQEAAGERGEALCLSCFWVLVSTLFSSWESTNDWRSYTSRPD